MALQMNVQTCQRCTKLFRQVRSPFCADCLDLIEMEFESKIGRASCRERV